MKSREITALEDVLGHRFAHPELLEQALTHSSQAREMEAARAPDRVSDRVSDNEQLEFLGDAVLGFVTTQEVFHRFPHFREGELSKLRAHLVSEKHLIRVAQQLELGHYLRLGRGEEKSGGRSKTFTVEARLHARNNKEAEFVGRAQGSTKKTAEQDAARQLLTFLASRPKAGEGKAARGSDPVEQKCDERSL